MGLGSLNTHPLNTIPLNGWQERVPEIIQLPLSSEAVCVPEEYRILTVAAVDDEFRPLCEQRQFSVLPVQDVIKVPPRSGSC